MLTEAQIVRHGRQILLREVGGRGQERLLASPVRALGSGPGLDDAVAWLLAGGTPVIAAPPLGGFLVGEDIVALNPDARSSREPVLELAPAGTASTARAQVVLGAGVAFRAPHACDDCWAQVLQRLPAGDPPAAGSLAALVSQRLILGWSEPLGLVLWNGDHFENAPIPACGHL